MTKPQDQTPNPTPAGPSPNLGTFLVATPTTEFYTEVRKGNIAGHSIVSMFGVNPLVAQAWVPINWTGDLLWQRTTATPIRIKAGGNVNDDANGTGAQEVTVAGLNAALEPAQVEIATAGAGQSVSPGTAFRRINAAWASDAGTYAGANLGDIVIEAVVGPQDFLTIPATYGEDRNSNVTCSANRRAFLLNLVVQMDANKEMSVRAKYMDRADTTVAPFGVARQAGEWTGITDPQPFKPQGAIGPTEVGTDIWFEAKLANQTGVVAISAEFMFVDADLVSSSEATYAERF